MTTLRSARLAAAVLALAACSKAADNKADSAASATATKTDSAGGALADSAHAAMAGPADSNATRGGWNANNVLGYATVANLGEIAEAKLAETKAMNPKVKAFAKQMLADHEAMLKDGKAMASKMKATPDTTTGAAHDLLNDSHGEMKDMQDKKAGADWDASFIDHEIDGHQKVLDKLQDASKNTSDADLRGMLEKATAKVQEHLTKAQDIKTNVLKK